MDVVEGLADLVHELHLVALAALDPLDLAERGPVVVEAEAGLLGIDEEVVVLHGDGRCVELGVSPESDVLDVEGPAVDVSLSRAALDVEVPALEDEGYVGPAIFQNGGLIGWLVYEMLEYENLEEVFMCS